jgi:glutathione S-transferase
VPALKFSGGPLHDEILTESAIVVQFLCDAHPSHLLPPSNAGPEAALFRARLNFFVDTWNTKIGSYMFSMFRADSNEEKEAKSKEWVAAVRKEIEPLLKNANPFFGGSKDLTLAEVCVMRAGAHSNTRLTTWTWQVIIAPFLLRIYALSNGDVLPVSVKEGLQKLPNFAKWANATMANESVRQTWDEEAVVSRTKSRIAKMKAHANGTANGTK